MNQTSSFDWLKEITVFVKGALMGKVLCFYREVALSCCEQAGLGGRRERMVFSFLAE